MRARPARRGLMILYSLPGLAGESVQDYQLRGLNGQLEQAINRE